MSRGLAMWRGGFDRSGLVHRGALALVLLWLVVFVVLPLGTLVDRSVRAKVEVGVWGENEVRVGGRRIQVVEGTLFIDGVVMETEAEGVVRQDGLEVAYDADALQNVTVSRIRFMNDIVPVAPVRIAYRNGRVAVDGRLLEQGAWHHTVRRSVGLRLFRRYFAEAGMRSSLFNSLFVSVCTSLLATSLALVYSYAVMRSCMPGRGLFRVVAMAPIFAPTMLYGLSLVYLFGNQGLVTTGLFGALPWLATDIGLYGPVGIVIAETIFAFPAAMVILVVAFQNTDARLYEAASLLGASPLRILLTVTLPAVRYGIISALFVCFTLAFTDFGAPKIVGGSFNVLAVDIYKQVIGQQNFSMGAAVSIILLVPAACAFGVQRLAQRRDTAMLTSRSVPYTPSPARWRDLFLFAYSSLVVLAIVLIMLTAGAASLMRTWPYDFALTLEHYRFADTGGGGYTALMNSVLAATMSAVIGTALTFFTAYLVLKGRLWKSVRRAMHGLSVLPLALPGLVIGIAYIFFFNQPRMLWGLLPNPFRPLYGTMAIIIVANIIHFYSVSYLTATAALKQLDDEFEEVGESLGTPFYRTFWRVTLPVCLPALLEMGAYYFVSSMATVSAVIFLYTADTRLASVAVVSMDDAGDTAPAAAMCMLIVLLNFMVKGVIEVIGAGLGRRMSAWRSR